jgi:phage terminase large subunit
LSILRIETARVFKPLLRPVRYKGAHGGRGSGKSHFFAEALVEKAMLEPGLRWACIREVQRSLEQSVKRLIEDKIEAMGVGGAFRVLQTHIETPGDGIIIFQGMQNHTAESIKSLEGYDGAWVEEAQSLSKTSLKLLTPTFRKNNSEIWFSWNPKKDDDPVDVFFRSGENDNDPDFVCVEANWSDNPWFPEVLRRDMERDRARDPDKYAHVWMGQYESASEARVFKNWTIEEFESPPRGPFYFGADWGFSIDPTVLVRCWIEGKKLYVDHEAYAVGCEIDRTPALFDTIGDGMARAWPIVADSARPETISFMKRNGYPRIRPAKKGAGSVEEGIEFLKNYDIVVHPRCKHTIDELTFYSYKTDPRTDEIMPVLDDKKNHVIDALRYAVETLRSKTKTAGVW